jgi:putative flippase GtrA
MSRARTHGVLSRFAVVGCVNFVVSFTVFYVCFHYLSRLGPLLGPLEGAQRLGGVRIDGAVANVCAYVAGMVNSFLLNRSWTFGATGRTSSQLARFVVVNAVTLTLSTSAMFHFVDVRGLPELVVWIPLTLVILVLNYLGCRHWAFAEPALQSSESR